MFLPKTGKRIVFGCDNIGDRAHFGSSGELISANLVSIVVAKAELALLVAVLLVALLRKSKDDFSEESSDCWVNCDEDVLFWLSSMLLLLESMFIGVAGGVWLSVDVGEGTGCSDEDDVSDFDEESMLSVLLRLPPMPDSGVGKSRCLSSELSGVFKPSLACLPSSLSGMATLILASEELDDIHVDVTISLSISLDEAPPPVSQELESPAEFEFEHGLVEVNSLLLLLRGDNIEHPGE